jgi:hypothetical protein
MGIYETWIVRRLLDLAMRSCLLDHYRQRMIETGRGDDVAGAIDDDRDL